MLMTGFRFVSQPVTVGNTNLLDTGLSNAATIEKCTFLESGRSIVDVRSPYAPPPEGSVRTLLFFYTGVAMAGIQPLNLLALTCF